jgi:hypothetical protein
MHPHLPKKPYLWRKQVAPFLRDHGYPYGASTIDKLCSPSINAGPPVVAWQGRRPLHDQDQTLAWAEGQLRPGRQARVPMKRSFKKSGMDSNPSRKKLAAR